MTTPTGAEILTRLDLASSDLREPGPSTARFPDGAQYRVEIPSTEGPACLAAVLAEADRLAVPVHRVSQGSGVFMLTDTELDEMAALAAERHVEVSLFARPTAGWGLSAMAVSPAGAAAAGVVRGNDQLAAALDDVCRAVAHGFRSVLVSDLGLLTIVDQARRAGLLPADLQVKVSVTLPVANPPAAKVVSELGAATLNIPTDLTIPQIAALRAVTPIPLDIYIEAPDSLGGFVRHHDIPDLVRLAAPVYLKFGLRNAPDLYPCGGHLSGTAIALSRERVRRARLGLDLLERSGLTAITHSPATAGGLAVPRPAHSPAH